MEQDQSWMVRLYFIHEETYSFIHLSLLQKTPHEFYQGCIEIPHLSWRTWICSFVTCTMYLHVHTCKGLNIEIFKHSKINVAKFCLMGSMPFFHVSLLPLKMKNHGHIFPFFLFLAIITTIMERVTYKFYLNKSSKTMKLRYKP